MSEFSVNGLKLFYEVHGNPTAAQTIAFFNGVMASANSWDLLRRIFEKADFKIVLHDFKGQLKSDKPAGPYSFAEHAEEAKALFDFLGIKKLHIVGTSYGGEVAMKFAVLFPDYASTITVIDSVSELDSVCEGFVAGWKILCDTGDGEKFFWAMLPSIYGPQFIQKNKAMLAERAKAIKSNPNNYLEGQKILYDTFIQDVDMTNELSAIRCPALIICGQDDILKPPRFSQIIANHIPHAEFIILPNCGHVAIFERAKEVESTVFGFVLKHCINHHNWY